MKITEKGQITIPIKIRNKYGFLPHSEVAFVEKNGEIYLKKMSEEKKRGFNIVNRLRGSATVRMSTDGILALTRSKK